MPSIRIRRPGSSAAAAVQPSQPDAEQSTSATAPPLPTTMTESPSSSSFAPMPPPVTSRRGTGRPSATSAARLLATASRNNRSAGRPTSSQHDDMDIDGPPSVSFDADANTDGEAGASSSLTSIDTPNSDMEDVNYAKNALASAASTPARKSPGRPRGSGRGRGRGRGAGAAGSSRLSAAGPDSESTESATASSSPATSSLKLSVRPRRSVAAQEDLDGEGMESADTKPLNAASTESNEGADASRDPSTMSQTPPNPSRRGKGRGRPRGRGRASLASFGDREAPSSPSARRGRRSAAMTSSAVQSDDDDDDDDDDDEAPTAEFSRSARGKRKRGVQDDEEPQSRDSDEGDADGAGDEDEDGEDDEDEVEESQAAKKASKSAKSKNNLPPFKKHPSRTKGYVLTFANHQTCLLRMSEEEIEEAKSRAKKKQGRGRKPRGGLSRTRMIEDSEDEDTDDDRPRPPPPGDQKEDEDDDKVMPIKERFKVKVMGKPWMMDMDELEMPDDPDGDKKVDALGNVLGDRQWKAPSFTSSLRADPNKVYFLSVDAARAVGYRDSLTLFRTDLRLIKLSLCQQEKDDLIAAGRLKEQLRGRNVTAVTARSVFKVHGAKAIKNGRAVIDDYYEAEARAKLESSGRLHSAGQVLPEEDVRTAAEIRRQADKERDRSRRPPDAIQIATNDPQGKVITTTFGDNGASPFMRSVNHISRRLAQQRADLTEENWMLEMALSVRGMNSELEQYRKDRLMELARADVEEAAGR